MNHDNTPSTSLARWVLMGVALAGSFLLVALDLGLDHYGVPRDEVHYHEASRKHITWLENIGQPGSFSDETLQKYFAWSPRTVIHPTFSRWLSGASWMVFHRWCGIDEIVALRLHNAFAFGLIAWGIVGFVLPRYGVMSAVVALLLLWGDVRLFGHTHSGQTDLVLTCLWLWAVLLAIRGIHEESKWAVIAAAVLAGAALSTKLTGLLLVGLLAVWPVWVRGRRGLWMAAAFLLIPPLVFYVLNPQSWHHPIGWTSHWLAQFRARKDDTYIPTLFLGKKYMFRAPWYAAAVHGLITIPPVILLLAGVAAADVVRRLWPADLRHWWTELRSPWMLCTAAGLAPLVACSLPGQPNHDLERLFLPLQPFLVLGAAYGFHQLSQSRWLLGLFSPAWAPPAVLATVLLLPTLVTAARYHPYELTYFNLLVGGPRGAQKLGFDVAYLKQEINQQVLDAVNEYVKPDAYLQCRFPWLDLLYHQHYGRLRKDIKIVMKESESLRPRQSSATYVLVYARYGWMDQLDRLLMQHPELAVWKLERHGVVLVALFRVGIRDNKLYIYPPHMAETQVDKAYRVVDLGVRENDVCRADAPCGAARCCERPTATIESSHDVRTSPSPSATIPLALGRRPRDG